MTWGAAQYTEKSSERTLKDWNLLIGQMLQQNGHKIFYARGFIDDDLD